MSVQPNANPSGKHVVQEIAAPTLNWIDAHVVPYDPAVHGTLETAETGMQIARNAEGKSAGGVPPRVGRLALEVS